jgi:hypothetical protein
VARSAAHRPVEHVELGGCAHLDRAAALLDACLHLCHHVGGTVAGHPDTAYYTDGSTSTFTVLLDNYFNPPDTPDNDVIASTPYLNSQGLGGRPLGQRQQTVYIFYTGVPISAGKTVRAVTLPTGGAIPSSGRITGMHVFAIGVG